MIKVSDLKDDQARNVFLYCEDCGRECSASPGDYWFAQKDKVFRCCTLPMVLASKKIVYEIVQR